MLVTELNREQIEQLKQNYLTNSLLETEDRTPSWFELSDADFIVSDTLIFETYADTVFTEDDFW